MAEAKALAPIPGALTPEERKANRLRRREERLQGLVMSALASSVRDVSLKRWMFADDEEMVAAGLSKRDIAKVRQWETPKKSIAFGLEAANQQVTAYIKRQQEKAGIKINVEQAVIQLPATRQDDPAPVIIDVKASDK